MEGAIRQVGNFDLAHRLPNDLMILHRFPSPTGKQPGLGTMGVAPPQDEFPDGHWKGDRRILEHDGDAPSPIPGSKLAEIRSEHLYRAALRAEQARQDLDERALPGSVWTKDAQDFSWPDVKRQILDDPGNGTVKRGM